MRFFFLISSDIAREMSAGAMMSGLMVGAGVGILILFRTNRKRKETLQIIAILYCAGVIGGLLTSLLKLV